MAGSMRFLFDVNHPAHVHLVRGTLESLRSRGHECRVTARDKDVTTRLLASYGLDYTVPAPIGRGLLGWTREFVQRELVLGALCRRFRPHVIAGTSINAARVARWVGARSVILNEDDASVVPIFARLAYPLASAIVTPECLAYEGHGPRHHTYPSYQELFYLHPSRFVPDPAVRAELGLAEGQRYALVRLSALQAHHDRGIQGLTADFLRRLRAAVVDEAGLRLFVSSEKPLDPEWEPLRLDLPPDRAHDALAFADLFVGDSQTMTAEAAVLGTPAFRLNGFVGRLSYLAELERYGLAFGFRPGEEGRLLESLAALLSDPGRREAMADRRRRMLAERIDPLPWLVALLERMGEEAAAAA
jgi:predicted glycosyltransferase